MEKLNVDSLRNEKGWIVNDRGIAHTVIAQGGEESSDYDIMGDGVLEVIVNPHGVRDSNIILNFLVDNSDMNYELHVDMNVVAEMVDLLRDKGLLE